MAAYLFLQLTNVPVGRAGVETGGLGWVRSIYGMSTKTADQLDRAQAAVTAPDGTIWVTDSVHRSLMQFAADGRFIRQLRGPAAEPLDSPSRFAIGADGRFYVCETAADAVRVLDANGNEAGSFRIPQPVSVAVTSDRIVVGSVAGFAILDLQGKPIKVIGSRGKGDGQFDYVHGVAIGSDGKIYVADSFNNRISAYDASGKQLWIVRTGKAANGAQMIGGKLEVTGTPDAQQMIQLPLGLTIDGAGRLVIIDMFDCTLAVLDPKNGSLISKYGAAGAEDGQFFYPVSVTYDPQRDWFTVADQLNNRVEIVTLPGSASGGAAVPAIQRALTGPLRACVFPLLLLILAVIAVLVVRAMRKRRGSARPAEPAPEAEDTDVPSEDEQ
jgi:tripartite motif-containing protein 71